MGGGHRRVRPLDFELDLAKRAGGERERQHGRADVVAEARQGQLLGAHGAADVVGRLDQEHAASVLGERDRGDESVRPGTDDHSVKTVCAHGERISPRLPAPSGAAAIFAHTRVPRPGDESTDS